ncbi:MAG: hypothetical protein WD509_00910 [Candidatus Paceibacterota bacterium]
MKNLSTHKNIITFALLILFLIIIALFYLNIQTAKDTPDGQITAAASKIMPGFISCIRTDGQSWRTSCMQELARAVQNKFGTVNVQEAIRMLEQQGQIGGLECHGFTHQIGQETLIQTNDIGLAFSQCGVTSACGLGCHHGVVEEYVAQEGRFDITKMRDLCTDLDNELFSDEVAIRYGCSHGLGHAAMISFQNNLLESLTWCDNLTEETDRGLCYIGASMEDAFSFSQADVVNPTENLLSTCADIPERYQQACFISRIPILIQESNYNWKAVFEFCENVPKGSRDACVYTVGYNSPAVFKTMEDGWNDLCTLFVEEGDLRSTCMQGLIEGRSSFGAGNLAEAYGSFCASLPNEYDYRDDCAYMSGIILHDWNAPESAQQCDVYFDDMAAMCKQGVDSMKE